MAAEEPEELTLPWSDSPVWRSVDCGPGWSSLIRDLDRDLRAIYPGYRVVQVKEKFGGLRFYTESVPNEVQDAFYARIQDTEQAAARTCEVCGALGEERLRRGWYRTLCDTHNAEFQAESPGQAL